MMYTAWMRLHEKACKNRRKKSSFVNLMNQQKEKEKPKESVH